MKILKVSRYRWLKHFGKCWKESKIEEVQRCEKGNDGVGNSTLGKCNASHFNTWSYSRTVFLESINNVHAAIKCYIKESINPQTFILWPVHCRITNVTQFYIIKLATDKLISKFCSMNQCIWKVGEEKKPKTFNQCEETFFGAYDWNKKHELFFFKNDFAK